MDGLDFSLAGVQDQIEESMTPKPLRIIKQRQKRLLGLSSGQLSIPSNGQENTVPHRQSSLFNACTQKNRSIFIAREPQGHGSLNVRKQRRSDTPCEDPGIGSTTAAKLPGTTSSYPPARSRFRRMHDLAPSIMDLNTMFNENTTVSSAIQAQERAVTIAALRNTALLSPYSDGHLIPQAPTPFVTHDPRRVVTVDGSHHDNVGLQGTDDFPRLGFRRQHSSRNRFFSRMMNSLTNKPDISHIATKPDRRMNLPHRALSSVSKTSEDPLPDTSRTNSTASAGTVSSLGGGFDDVLAAFPTPPSSTITSSTTFDAFEHVPNDLATPRMPCKNKFNAIAGIEIGIIPEHNSLTSDGGQNMFVAVEMKAAPNFLGLGDEAASSSYRLDVAIVIDNSLFASPATLMASCETARYVASLLDTSTDRMAILCTMPLNPNDPQSTIVSLLTEATVRTAKSTVDTIVGSIDKPDLNAMSAALLSARTLLVQSSAHVPGTNQSQVALGHIIVLSSNLNGLRADDLEHENIQTHFVCPGCVPWQFAGEVHRKGWNLRSMYTNELQFVTSVKDMDENSLFNRLRGLISYARSGASSGELTDLVIQITAGPGCSIEGIMGKKKMSSLRLGDVAHALVKLKIGAPAVEGYSLSTSQTRMPTQPEPYDLLDELDGLLGNSATTVLTAEVKYRHSLLPPDTECTVVADSRLKRQEPKIGSRKSPKVSPLEIGDSQVAVQKRLVFHLATHYTPRHAILTLRKEFGDAGCQSVCSDYVKIVLEELKYQARIIERFDIVNTGASPIFETPQSEFEPSGHGLFDLTNYKPQEWTTDAPEEDTSPSSRSSSSTQQHKKLPQQRKASGETVDEARKIWGDLRKMSGRRQETGTKVQTRDERMMREEALRNKRSIGAETLRSFAGGNRGKESFAPWA